MRFILDLTQHPAVEQSFEEYQQGLESFKQRREFLKRQFDNLGEEIEKRQEEFWASVRDYAKQEKLVPDDFDQEKHCLELDKKSKQLFMFDKEDHENHHGMEGHPLGTIIAAIMKGPPPDGKV
jgi:hypothetical protein